MWSDLEKRLTAQLKEPIDRVMKLHRLTNAAAPVSGVSVGDRPGFSCHRGNQRNRRALCSLGLSAQIGFQGTAGLIHRRAVKGILDVQPAVADPAAAQLV